MTLSHTRDGSGRCSRRDGKKLLASSSHHSTFNIEIMKRSLSGTNYNSLLRPLLQPSSSTGLEDRPPPPPAPTQMQHQQRRGGLFTKQQPHPLQNVFMGSFNDTENVSKFDVERRQRGIENLTSNYGSDERKQNLTQSPAHKNITNNVSPTAVQQRLYKIQQSSELEAKPDASATTVSIIHCNTCRYNEISFYVELLLLFKIKNV